MIETSLYLCSYHILVLVEKGLPISNTSVKSDKENVTTFITVNALSQLPSPLTIGKTHHQVFFEYLATIFLPYLKNRSITMPITVFLDEYYSHLIVSLRRFYQQTNLVLVALYSNSTHILQTLDVSFFFR